MWKGLAVVAGLVAIVVYLSTRTDHQSPDGQTPSVGAPVARVGPITRQGYSPASAPPQLPDEPPLEQQQPQKPPRKPDPLEYNPIAQVTSRSLNAATEREALITALTDSGPASGEWVDGARDRMAEVKQYLSQGELGEASDLGCFDAGCAVKVAFHDAEAAQHPETLTNPFKTGRWPNGVVFTEPRRVDEGSQRYTTWVFFLAPPPS